MVLKTKKFIQYIRKKRIAEFWKMPHIRLLTGCGLSAGILFILSYFARPYHPWLSPFFQSVGAGIITGIIVYVLGNLRNRKEAYLDRIIPQLDDVYRCEEKIYNQAFPFKLKRPLLPFAKEPDPTEAIFEMFESAVEYINALENLDYYLLKQLIVETNVNFEQMRILLSNLEDEVPEEVSAHDVVKYSGRIIEIIQKTADWVEEQREKAEIQRSQLSKYPL